MPSISELRLPTCRRFLTFAFAGLAAVGLPASGDESPLAFSGLKERREVRVVLKGEVDGQDFGPLAATIHLAPERLTRQTTVAITVDGDGNFGSVLWLAANARELEARVPPYTFTAAERTFEVRIADTAVHAARLPTWVAPAGEGMPGWPWYCQAESGFVKLESTEAGVHGRIELAGKAWVSQRACEYRADISPLTASSQVPTPAPPAAPLALAEEELPPEMWLASKGDAAFFDRKFEKAAELYGQSLAIYRQRTARPTQSLRQDGDWISQKNLLAKLALCHLQFREPRYDLLLQHLAQAVEVDRRLRASGYLKAELRIDPYFPVLEDWRIGRESDRDKVEALEKSQRLLEILLVYFLDQGSPERALEVAELAKARAYADLLAKRNHEVVAPQPLIYRDIQEQVKKRSGPVIEYFVTERFLAIWLLTPTGEMSFVSVPVPRRELEEKLDEVRAALERGALAEIGSSFRADLRQLYDWLWAPIAQKLPASPAQAVTVVGQGQLLRLPFAALPFGDGPEDWVVFRHALLYSPSLAVLEQLEKRPPTSPEWQLLAFLDPQPLPEELGKILGEALLAPALLTGC